MKRTTKHNIRHYMNRLVLSFSLTLLLNSFISAQSPELTIAQLPHCPNGQVSIPVTANNLEDIGALSIFMTYDPASLTFVTIDNVHPAIQSIFYAAHVLPVSTNMVGVQWFLQNLTVPVTVPDGDTLFHVVFDHLANSSAVSFYNAVPYLTEVYDYEGNIVLPLTLNNGGVTVPAPISISISGDDEYCENDNLLLTANASGGGGTDYTYQWLDPSFNPIASTAQLSISNVLPSQSGTYLVSVAENNSLCDDSEFITITIHPRPTIQVDASNPICDSTTLSLSTITSSGTLPYSFAWTAPNGWTGSGDAPVIDPATLADGNDTIYTVIITDLYGCKDTASTADIVIFPKPTVDDIPSIVLCNGDNTPVIAFSGPVPGTTFTWTNNTPSIGIPAGGTGNILSVAAMNGGSANVVATITVTPHANGCTGNSKTFTVTVMPTPAVDFIADQVHCNADPVSLTPVTGPVAGSVYTWTNSNPAIGLAAGGVGDIPAFTATNGGTAPVSATISITPAYTFSGVTCTGSTISYSITVNPTGQVNPPADQVKCNTDLTSVTFGTNNTLGITTYAWSNDNTTIGLAASGNGDISFTATNTGTAPITGTIIVTPTFTYGGTSCTGPTQSFTITVNPTGQVNLPADQVKCNTDLTTVIFTTTHTVGVTTFAWSNDNTAIGLGASGSGDISFTATNTGTAPISGLITVTPTFTYGGTSCTGPAQSFTITVNPTGQVDLPADQVKCNTDLTMVTFTTTHSMGVTTFAWSNDNTAIGLAATGSGDISFTASNTGTAPISGIITVTPTFTNGGTSCTGPAQSFTITVNPTGQVDQPADQVKCNTDLTMVTFTTTHTLGVTTYAWSNDNTAIGLAASGNGDISFTATNTGTTPISGLITVTPTFTYGGTSCTGPAQSFTITVNPTGQVNPPADQVKCNTDLTSVTFTTTHTMGVTTYAWSNDNTAIGLAATGSGDISFTATNAGTAPISGLITVTPTFTYGGTSCTGPAQSFTITVNPTGQVNPPADQVKCNTDLTTVTFTTNNTIGITTFAWSNDNTAIGLAASGSGDISFTAANTGTAPISGTITVTPTFTYGGTSCTGPAQSFTITVNPTGQVNQPADQVKCNTDLTTVTFTTTHSVGVTTYAWSNDNTAIGLAASGNGDISFSATNTGTAPISGLITVTPTFTYGGTSCTGPTQSFTITVNPTGQVDQPADQVKCNTDLTSVTFTTTHTVGVTTYAWSNDNTAIGLAASGNGDISFTATNTGTTPISGLITVTPTFTYGGTSCTGPAQSFTITVNPTAQVNPPTDQVKCNTDLTSVTFTTTHTVGVTTYAWSNDNTAIGLAASGNGDISFTATNTGTAPISGIITVTPTFTNGGTSCTGPAKSFTITVNPTGQVDLPTDQVKCNTDLTSVTFTTTHSVGVTTYAWSNDNIAIGLAATGSGDIFFTATNTGTTPITGLITVTPTFTFGGTSCTGPTQSFTITVNPTGQVNQPADQVKCNTDLTTVTFTTSNTAGTTTYAWTNDNTAIGLAATGNGDISFTATNTGTNPITGTIIVTPTFTNAANACPGPSQSFTITVNPTGQVDIVPDQERCHNTLTDFIAFTTINTGGITTYAWSHNTPGIGLPVSGTGNIPAFTAINASATPVVATFTVTPTFSFGGTACPGPVETFTITINPRPNANAGPDQTISNGAFTTLNGSAANSPGPFGYAWTPPGMLVSSNIPDPQTVNLSTTQVYTLVVTDLTTGCSSLPDNVIIIVEGGPLGVIASADPPVICFGDSTTLSALGAGGTGLYTYTWSSNPVGFSAGTDNTVTFPQQSAWYIVSIDDGFNTEMDSVFVTVNPKPEISASSNTPICDSTAINLITSVTGGTPAFSYAWNAPNGWTGADEPNPIIAVASLAGNYNTTYTVVVTDLNGCRDTATTDVFIFPKPTVDDIPAVVICNGDNTPVIAFSGPVPGTTFTWTNNTPSIGIPAGGTGNILSVAAMNGGSANVVATITVTPHANGCTGNSKTFTVTVMPTPAVDFIADQVHCNADPVSLTPVTGPVAGSVYTWTNSNPAIGLAAGGVGDIPAFTATNGGTAPVSATISITPAYTFSGVTCTGSTISYSITVNPTGQVNPPADQVKCNTDLTSVTFGTNNTLGITTYAWSNDNIAIGLAASGSGDISFTATNAGTAPITGTIIVTPTFTYGGASCTGPVQSFSITVNPTGQVNQPADQVKCNTDLTTVIFTTTHSVGVTTYAWSNDNTAIGLAASGSGDISFTATNAGIAPISGTITVTPTFTYGGTSCTGPAQSFTITVNPTGQVNPPADQVKCNTDLTSVTFTTTHTVGVTTFAWSNDNTAIGLAASGNGDISFTATNTGTNPISGLITVTPTFSYGGTSCTGPAQSFTITVNPTGQVNPPADQVKCNTDLTSVTFTTTHTVGVTTYAWSNDNTAIGLAASGNGDISFTATNTGTTPISGLITVTPTFTYGGTSCTGPAQSFTITVNPTGQADLPADQVKCNTDLTSVTFTTNNTVGITTYAWSNDNTAIGLAATGSGDISFTATNAGTAPISGLITVTPTFTYGGTSCTGPAQSFTITVNPTGQVNPPADQVKCNTDLTTVTFTTNNTIGITTFAWSNDNTAIGLAATGSGDISFTATNTGTAPITGTIIVTPTFTYGGTSCTGPSQSFTITVNPTAQVDQPADQVKCNTDLTTVTFTTTHSVGVTTFAWSNDNTTIGLAATGSGDISFTATNTGTAPITGLITVTPTFTYGGTSCTGPAQSFTITVNPTGQVDQPVDQVKCNTDLTSVTFTTTHTVGVTTYAWSNDNTAIGLAASGNGDISFTATNTGTTPISGLITVTPTFTYGSTSCTGPAQSFTITVNPTGQVDQPADQVKCNTDLTTVTFTTTHTVGVTTYAWSNDNTAIGLAASGNGDISFTATNTGTAPISGLITVTPTFTYGGTSCTGPAQSFTITVNPTGQVDQPADQVRCNQDQTDVLFTTQNTVGVTTYAWSNDNTAIGLAATGSGDISFTATNTGTVPISGIITVTPTFTYHGTSCTGPAQSFTITVNPTAQVNQPSDQVKCNADLTTVTFTTSNTAGTTTYAWSNDNTAIGLAASGNGDISFTATNTGNNPITGTIIVTPTFTNAANACPGPPQSFNITVNPTGQVDIVPDQELCHNTLTNFIAFTTINTGGITTYQWAHNSPGIGLPVSGTGNIPAFTAINGGATPMVVTFTVTPTFSFGGTACPGPVETFTITINPRPNADAGPDQTIANGAFTTLNGSAANSPGPFGYAWTPPAMLVSSNIPDPQTVNLSTTQVYTLVVTDLTTGCSSLPDNVTIIVQGGPLGVIASADPPVICFGDSTTLSALGAGGTGLYTYTWTSNPVGFSAGTDNTVTFPQQSAWYIVSIDDGFNTEMDSVFVTVNPKPEISASSNTPICDSTAINLITSVTGGTPAFSYAWNAPNGWTGADEPNPIIAVASLAGNYNTTYTVVVTDLNGCRDTATTDVFIFPKPTVDDIPAVVICNGDNTPVIAFSGPVPGTTFTWTNNTPSIGIPAGGTGNILSVAAMNGGSANVVATITVTPHANGCTGNSKTFTVTVMPTPAVDFIADQVHCNADPVSLTPVTGPVAGSVYTWTNSNPAIGLAAGGVGDIPAFTATNGGTAPVSATISITPAYTFSGVTCTGSTISYSITVNPTGQVNPPADQVKCNTDLTSVTFGTNNTLGITTYAWSNDNTAIGLAASGNGDISFTATNTGTAPITGTIIVTPTFTYGGTSCTGPVQSFTITVNPTAQVDQPADQVKCNTDLTTVTFTTTHTVGVTTYAWSNDNTAIGLAASGNGDITFTATNAGTAPISGIITVTPTFTYGGTSCTGPTQSFTITVNPTGQVDQPADQVKCNTDLTFVTFTTTHTVGVTTYAWSNDNTPIGLAASGNGDISFTATNTGTTPISGLITVTPTFTYGGTSCTGPAQSFTITVNPTGQVNPPADQVKCNTDLTSVTFTTTHTVGVTTYAWSNDNIAIGLAASGNGDISFTATNTGTAPISGLITVTPTFTYGGTSCTGPAQSFTITVNPTGQVDLPADQVKCNTDLTSVTFTTNNTVGITTYAWSNDNPAIGLAANGSGDISFTATNTGTAPISGLITVTPTFTYGGTSCTGPAQSFTITVNPTGQVDQPADQVKCNTDLTTVNFITNNTVGITTFDWSNDNTAIGLAASGSGDISFTAANTGTAPITGTIIVTPTFTYGGTSCTGPSQSFTITVNPTGQVDQPADQVKCNTDLTTVTFTTNNTVGITTFAWSNDNTTIGLAATGSGDISFTATNTGTAPIIGTITVTPTFTYGGTSCTGPAQSFTITVNPTGQVNPPADQVKCNTDMTSVIFTTNNTLGVTTYAWSNDNTAIGLAATGSGDISFTATNTGTAPISGLITVTPTFTFGGTSCTGPAQSFTIAVNPTGQVDQPADQVKCNTDLTTVTFTTTHSGGVTTFAWSNDNTAIGLAASGNGDISFTATNTGTAPISGTITVTPTFTYGGTSCTGPAQSFTVTVNPTAQVDQPADQVRCNQDQTDVLFTTQNTVGVTTYAWSNDNTAIGLAAAGSGDISFTATNTGNAPISGIITVTPTFTYGGTSCTGPAQSFTITVNPTAQVNQPSDQVKCNTDLTMVTFTTNNTAGTTTYAWTNDNTAIGLAATGNGDISFTATNTGNSPISGTIIVTPTFTNAANACPGPSQSFTITVNPTGQVDIVPDQELCHNTPTNAISFTTINTGGITTYQWAHNSPGIGLPVSGTGNIPAFTAINGGATPMVVTFTVTPTFSFGGTDCPGQVETFTITINPRPLANAGPDQTIPYGTSTTLSGSASGSPGPYLFAWSPALYLLNTSIADPGTTNLYATTTYVLTVTDDGSRCISISDTVIVYLSGTPLWDTIIPDPDVICYGHESILNTTVTGGSLNYTFNWASVPPGFTSSDQSPVVSPLVSTWYYVTVYDGFNTVIDSTLITVNPLPIPTIGSNAPLCMGETLNLTSGGGNAYQWSGPNGFNQTIQNPSIPNVTLAATGLYKVTVTDLNGCSDSIATSIVIFSLPTATANTSTPVICENETILMTGAASGGSGTGYQYAWTGPSSFSSTNQNPFILNATTANTGTYSLVVQDSHGCFSTNNASFTVTVNPRPTATASASPTTLCANGTINFTGGFTGGGGSITSWTWSGPASFTSALQNPSVTNAQVVNGGTYSLTVTDNNNCSSAVPASVTVTVHPRPVASASATPTELCQNGNIQFDGGASGGAGTPYTYLWNGPSGFSSTSEDPQITNAQVVNSGVYSLTVSDVNCPSASPAQVTITVRPRPVASVSSTTTTICAGQSILLTGGQSGGTGPYSYAWSGPNTYTSNLQNPSITNAQTTHSGSYSLTVTDVYNCSSTNNPSVSITVNPLPVPSAGSDSPICFGQTLNLTSGGGTSYAWSGPNTFSSLLQNPSITNASLAATGIYTVTVTNQYNCSATTTTSVTVNPLPSPVAGSNSPICAGATLNLTCAPNGLASYSWSGPNSFTSNAQNPSITNAQPAASGVYTVTATNSFNCQNTATTTVTVNPLPVANAGPDQTINYGTYTNLSGSATGCNNCGYLWQPAAMLSTSNTITNPTTVNLTATQAYSLVVTNNTTTCISLPDTVIITVTGSPLEITTLTADPDTICNGSNTQLEAIVEGGNLVYTYTWAPAATLSNNTIANPVAYPTTTTTYTLTVNDGFNTVTGQITIVVTPYPTINAGPDTIICMNDVLSINLSQATNYASVSWSTGGDGNFSDNSILHPDYTPGPNDKLNGGVTLTLTVNGNSPCPSLTDSFFLTISEQTVAYAGPNDTICAGETYALTQSSTVNANAVTWTTSGTGTFSDPHILNPVYFPSPADATLGSVTLSLNAVNTTLFCGDSTDQMVLTITPLPLADAGPNVMICLGDSTQLNASGGTAYLWNPPSGLNAVNIPDPIAKPVNSTTYTVIVTANGCSKTDTVRVTVRPLPPANAGPDTDICVGDSTRLSATGGFSYLWSNNATTPSTWVKPVITTTYYVTAYDDFGCENTDDVVVTVHPLPVVSITPPYAHICRDSSVRLNASGASIYYWSPASGISSIVGSMVDAFPKQTTNYQVTGISAYGCESHTFVPIYVHPTPVVSLRDSAYLCLGNPFYLNAGFNDSASYQWQNGSTGQYFFVTQPGLYWVNVSNEGCMVSDTVLIDICTSVWIPNSFIPDGNNQNDVFQVKSSTELKHYQIYIYNRWGEVIFESDDINESWDGTYDGKDCPQGVYVYVVTWEGQGNLASEREGMKKGTILLIR